MVQIKIVVVVIVVVVVFVVVVEGGMDGWSWMNNFICVIVSRLHSLNKLHCNWGHNKLANKQ